MLAILVVLLELVSENHLGVADTNPVGYFSLVIII